MSGTFKDCRRGIEFMSYQNTTGSGSPIPNLSYVHNTFFITTDDYPENEYPFAGITAYSVQGIGIRNNVFENQRSDLSSLLYSQRGSGIQSTDAALTIRSFTNFLGVPTAGTGNEFKNLFYGIYTTDGYKGENLTVLDNTFTNCLYGIGLTGSNYSVVGRNEILVPLVPDSDPQADFAFGIYTDYGNGFNLEQNDIMSLGFGFNSSNQGIHVKNSSPINSHSAYVYKNEISGVKYGLQLTEQNHHLEVDCNQFVKGLASTIDIHYASGSLASQGDCSTKPVKNTFGGSCNSSGLAQLYQEQGTSLFLYLYAPNTLSSSCHNLSWLATECGSTPENTCPNTLPGGIILMSQSQEEEINTLQQEISYLQQEMEEAKNQLKKGKNVALITGMETLSKEQLKNELLNASPYLSDEILLTYIQKAQNEEQLTADALDVALANTPLSSEVVNALESLAISPLTANQINEEQQGIPNRTQLESNYNQLKRNKINAMNRLTKRYLDSNQVTEAMLFFESDSSLEASLISLKLALRQEDFSNATAQLTHITTLCETYTNPSLEEQEEMESLLAFYELSIALAQQEGGMYSTDSLQLIQLNEIASTPTLAGRQARAMIQFRNEEQPYFNGQEAYFPKSMTAEEGYDLLTVGEIASLFDVFPNPAQDEATIRVKDTERIYSIIITDLNGKIMSIHSEITDFMQLDIAQLSNGTYLIHLVDGETRIETKKLVKM